MKILFKIKNKQSGDVVYEGTLSYPDDISEAMLAGSLAYQHSDLLEQFFEVKFMKPKKISHENNMGIGSG